MEQLLHNSFMKIQDKIDEIFNTKELHIKQIADLERYLLMQGNILDAMLIAKKVAERS